MEVCLVQHGESRPESEDLKRPLTDKGTADVEHVALYIAGLGLHVTRNFPFKQAESKTNCRDFRPAPGAHPNCPGAERPWTFGRSSSDKAINPRGGKVAHACVTSPPI